MAHRLNRKQKAIADNHMIAKDQWSRYVRARDGGHIDYLKTAKKCDDYYVGEQWDEKDIQKLKSQGRPYLTINMVLDTVNTVLGEQTQKRVEFKYKPAQGGSEEVATVLTKIAQAIKDSNKYDYIESKVFADACIAHGRGFFDIRMRFDTNMRGDIVIRSDDPRNILLDPDAKEYEPETWTELYETRWMSVDEIETTYGRKKADEVRAVGINANRFDSDSIIWEGDSFGDARSKEQTIWMPHSAGEEKSIRLVRVIERQHVKYVPVTKFVDAFTGDMKTVPPGWSQRRVAEFAEKLQLFVVQQVDKKIRWTVTADNVVLHDDWSPYATFTKIPFFCYFRRGRPLGVVTNLLSPQDQLNKLSSQELHIVNTTANSGWIIEEGTLSGGMTADDLRNQGAETGLVLTVAKNRKEGLEKIKPNQVPTGIERLANRAAASFKVISGIDESLMGGASPELSGVALDQQEFRGLVKLQIPFDNLDLTRRLVSDKIIELLQQFYTEERVFKITSESLDFGDPEEEEVIINTVDAVGEVVNDITTGRYDTTLAMFPARDSFNDSQFAEAVNLRTIGVAIPDDRIVEYSHLARKDQLAEEIRKNEGRGELTEAQAAQIEFEQRVQSELMMLEVRKGEAEVLKLEAEAEKIAAEAEQKDGGLDSPEFRIKIAQIEAQIQIAREGNELRRALANLSATSRLDQSVLTTRGKLLTDRSKERENRETQLLTGEQQARTLRTKNKE